MSVSSVLNFIKNSILIFTGSAIIIASVAFITFAGLKITNQAEGLVKLPPKQNTKPLENKEIAKSQINNTATLPTVSKPDEPILKELPSEAQLKIPLIYQKYNLSCEAASLEMAFSYRGIKLNQDEIMKQIGYALPVKKTYTNGKAVWGDPDLGFVGNEKGYLFSDRNLALGNGWGVNNGPVAKVANNLRPGSLEKDNANITDIKQALANDKPVIFWHARDDALKGEFKYQTPEGKSISLFQNHVNVLTGYKTNSKNETLYYFNDPIYGKYTLPEKDMLRIWAKYNNDIVVIN